jgi:hypothetical protein
VALCGFDSQWPLYYQPHESPHPAENFGCDDNNIFDTYDSGLLATIVQGAAKIIQPPMNADERR